MSSPQAGSLTLEAKKALSERIRALRPRLLDILRQDAEREYRLSVPLGRAGLSEAPRVHRQRLEDHLEQRVRALPDKERAHAAQQEAARDRFLREAEKEAAYTLLHRLVFLRLLEARGLSRTKVVTGGKNSTGYKTFREFAPGLCGDESDQTEGYGLLLRLIFDELALELPGLFGEVGLSRLFPVREAALQAVLELLNDPTLRDAWTDDTTLGWVYQYWNDPEREGLDAKIKEGGKIEPHEIASKTQMFTERYMVEWLLHNTLGLTWLLMCRRHGWRADAEDVLPVLEERRRAFRGRRERGEVAADELMPVEAGLEERWKYYVEQPLPEVAVRGAPETLRGLRLLDPACGSGHFLVIAFDLLAALHREEARHRGQEVTDEEIARWIVEENLYGVDIDPRAVQVAAMGLYLKGRELCGGYRPGRMNLVAPTLRLGGLAVDDPALLRLRQEVLRETGIEEAVTDGIVRGLKGADHLGTLLRLDRAVEEALRAQEERLGAAGRRGAVQGDLLTGSFGGQQIELKAARATLLEKLEQFLERHATEEDLGLRLDGEQLVAGVRFIRMMKEGTYDLVVGNPPYQGTARMADAGYVGQHYPRGKADLYAAFLERALELTRPGGFSGLLTMRGWMFVGQYEELRQHLLRWYDLRTVGDVDRGAFSEVPDEVLAASMTVFRKPLFPWRLLQKMKYWPARGPRLWSAESVAMQPTPPSDKSRDSGRTARKRAAVLAQVGRFEFHVKELAGIDASPLVYWWSEGLLTRYSAAPKLGRISAARKGICTNDDVRYIREWWELREESILVSRFDKECGNEIRGDLRWARWAPTIKGGQGRSWFEPLVDVINWAIYGLDLNVWIEDYRIKIPGQYIRNVECYFSLGIAFTMIGNSFSARAHRYRSIFGNMGSSVFPEDIPTTLCMMNSATSRYILQSLNPGVHFEVGDVNRLPIFPIENSAEIYATIERAFSEHEAAREASVEFRRPGPSPWRYAQDWAQRAVDRPAGTPLKWTPFFGPSAKVEIDACSRQTRSNDHEEQAHQAQSVVQGPGSPGSPPRTGDHRGDCPSVQGPLQHRLQVAAAALGEPTPRLRARGAQYRPDPRTRGRAAPENRRADHRARFFSQRARSLPMRERRALIEPTIPPSLRRQCELLAVNRSSLYYTPVETDPEELALMRQIDELHLEHPFFGSRMMTQTLKMKGLVVNRKRVRRLMRLMDLESLAPQPKTSSPAPEHPVYPYLLRGLTVCRINQAWAADITYIPMACGFAYLVAIIDWYSRRVLAWRLSNTLETDFCVETLLEALSHFGVPEIFNTDQGAQFTADSFTQVLRAHGIKISMDGKGRCIDNIFVERLWRSLKYEEVYLNPYDTMREADQGIDGYMSFFNHERPHQALGYQTPASFYDEQKREAA